MRCIAVITELLLDPTMSCCGVHEQVLVHHVAPRGTISCSAVLRRYYDPHHDYGQAHPHRHTHTHTRERERDTETHRLNENEADNQKCTRFPAGNHLVTAHGGISERSDLQNNFQLAFAKVGEKYGEMQ